MKMKSLLTRVANRLIPCALAAGAMLAGGCTRPEAEAPDVSALEGLSASATASNVAVMMTAYSYTPGYAGMFEQDMANFREVVQDPKGNYRFKTSIGQRAGHQRMVSLIRDGAAQVSEDGTLLVFITAHGANNGTIQPEDQGYATFGYASILEAIKAGRNGKGGFRRLVLFVSACYSGSWINTLQSSNGLFKERLVITSVGPYELSYIGNSSRAVFDAFSQLKDKPSATMAQFLNVSRQGAPSLMFSAAPESLLKETLINSADPTPTDPTPDPDPVPTPEFESRAVTSVHNGQLTLFLYDSRADVRFEVYSRVQDAWLAVSNPFPAQDKWPTIAGLGVADNWNDYDTVSVRTTAADGQQSTVEIKLSHL